MKSTKPDGETFKYVDIDAIDNKRNIITSIKVIETKSAPSRASRYTEKGDVLFSMVRPYLRNIAMISEDNCIASTGFYVCHTKEFMNSHYCLYLMLSDYVVNGLNEFMKGDNSPSITKGQIDSFAFPLPPINEQKRIVEVIESWAQLIDYLEIDKIELVENIAQAKSKILDLAIHGKLVPQDPSEESAIELLRRINPKFEPCDNAHDTNQLPNGWTKAVLNDVCQIIMGSSPNGEDINSTKEGVEFHQGKLNFSDLYVNPSDSYTTIITKLAPKDSILLCVRAPVGVVNITPRLVCIGRGLCSLSPKGEMNLMFLFYALQTFQPHFEENATGTTFKAIGGEIVRQSNLSVPPINEQARIVAKIEELFAVLDDIKESLEA